MNYRSLGKTGLRVSEIGFGCGSVGGIMIREGPSERARAVRRALELGINYFDTAPSYGDGVSEINLGRVLKELRAEVYVGTKVRLEADESRDIRGAIFHSVEESLRRLDRESVELVQLHNRISQHCNAAQASLSVEDVLGEVVEAFQSLQAQGKARFYGITGLGATEALEQVVGSGMLYTVQACYNLLNPSAGQEVPPNFDLQDFRRIIDRAAEKETGVIVIRVLAAGALNGGEERHPVAAPSVVPIGSGHDYQEDVKRARSFDFLVKEGYVKDRVEAALRFALSKREISTVLVGFSSLEQLERSIECASRGPLPSQALSRLPQAWAQMAGA